MSFIEMTGETLDKVLSDDELHHDNLEAAAVTPTCIVLCNKQGDSEKQGDIEVRRPDRWEVIGGLLGDFDARIHKETGLDWV